MPSSLSETGIKRVENDAAWIASKVARDEARAALLVLYPSIQDGKLVDDGLYEEFDRARRAHNNLSRTLSQRIFRQEVENYVRTASATTTALQPETSLPSSSLMSLPPDKSRTSIPTISPEVQTSVTLITPRSLSEEDIGAHDDRDIDSEEARECQYPDPTMLHELDPDVIFLKNMKAKMSLDQTDALLESIGRDEDQDGDDFEEEDPVDGWAVGTKGVSNEEVDSIEGAAAQEVAAEQLSAPVDIEALKSSSSLHLNERLRLHFVDSFSRGPLSSRIYRYCYSPLAAQIESLHKRIVSGEMDDTAATNQLMTVFSSDRFPYDLPLHWRPLEGQIHCVFGCGAPVLSADGRCLPTAYAHSKSCATAEAARTSKERFGELVVASFHPCNWKSRLSKKDGTKGVCGHTAANAHEQHKHHFGSHVNNSKRVQKNFTCRFGACGDSPSVFKTPQELGDHFMAIHSIPDFTAPSTLSVWCPYCEVYLSESKASIRHEQHLASHADEAFNTVANSGFLNVLLGNDRIMKHAYCIWCLYHDEKSPVDRFEGYTHQSNLPTHMWQEHIEKLLSDEKRQYYCPSSLANGAQISHCAYDGLMTGPELLDHVEVVHKFPVPRREPQLGTRLYTFIKHAKRGADALEDDDEDDIDDVNDPVPGLASSDRPVLSSVPANRPRGRPRKTKIEALDEKALKGKQVQGKQVKGKGRG